jgi:hypothetical protein
MSADHGAIDDRADFIKLELQLLEHDGPVALLRPVGEAVEDGFPRPEALGEVASRHAGLGAEEHGLDEQAVATKSSRPGPLRWKNTLQAAPLLIGERVTVHGDL